MEVELKKYMGKWYEIARIPTCFELNMKNVTAQYDLNKDGTVKIVNSGYVNGQLRQVTATASLTDKDDLLKVSFFPTMFTDYKIVAVDKDYKYAIVGGKCKYHLWLLSRTPNISQTMYNELINIAKNEGYDTNRLVITES